jgi:hypothetical protein
VILSVGKSINGDVLAGRRFALRVSLLIKVIFFDGCIFHCPCASVEKIFKIGIFVEITGVADNGMSALAGYFDSDLA